MFTTTTSRLLDRNAALLDVSIEDQEAAISRYNDLGSYLLENLIGRADVEVYPQGSFKLGTVVRPADGGGDFDIDLVFLRDLRRNSITQESLKATAGDLVQSYCTERGFDEPTELGRCWRLDFFEQHFHLDVLPVIPNDDHPGTGILLSDRDLTEWLPSNPSGYANWFYERMGESLLDEYRASLAAKLNRSIEEVPTFLLRTPLQRVVQLLKRSRDEFFADDPEVKPPSILITTLAGRAYAGQRELDAALVETAKAMPGFVERRGDKWWVENPADPEENFADKWNTHPGRREAFYQWMTYLTGTTETAIASTNAERAAHALSPVFGSLVTEAMRDILGAEQSHSFRASRGEAPAPNEQRIEDLFPVHLTHTVTVSFEVGELSKPNRYARRALKRRRIAKQRAIWFQVVETTTPPPYEVYWKVRNFGRQALELNQLRGEITRGDLTHYEVSRYTGDHYVECYVVKSGECVARTRIWVPIE